MAKFRVEVVCERTTRTVIEVEADSAFDAEDQVQDLLYAGSDESAELIEKLRFEGSPLININVKGGAE